MTDFDAFDEDTAHASGLLKWEMPGVSGHWVAEMDFGTAPVVEEALVSAIRRGFLGYMPQGLSAWVKEATASVVGRRYGLEIEAKNVRLASSVLDGLNAILGHMLKPGSRVIVPTPAYMPFLTLPGKFGHEVIQVPSAIVEGVWQLDFDRIETVAKDADLLILCNPWNPTGRVLTVGELTRLGEIATGNNLLVFNDEIHAPLVSNPSSHICFAGLDQSFADLTVTAVAASKGFNLAGLHCAQMITTGQMTHRFEAAAAWLNHPTPLGALATSVAYEEG
ncbi:aminotransferase class I/II-fold pyridoxal phosphate-dependent enzyme, partial [uncultured Tessaracoccus sp.]|uniref:aminotransferase class I/II-fold pyridoxal phosphate-dependent enzyme n=1 Tax=uncultured Tessaracoccus sp. TaxID=905023 RepID=UPI00260FFF70